MLPKSATLSKESFDLLLSTLLQHVAGVDRTLGSNSIGSICCGSVARQVVSVYNRSTTNRSDAVCALSSQGRDGRLSTADVWSRGLHWMIFFGLVWLTGCSDVPEIREV